MSQNEGMCKSVHKTYMVAAESAYTWLSGGLIVRCWKTEHNQLRWSNCKFLKRCVMASESAETFHNQSGIALYHQIFRWKNPAQIVTLHVHVWSEGWKQSGTYGIRSFNPLRLHDALKHFTSLKTHLIFLQRRALEWKSPCNWLINTWQFWSIFKPHQIIFIHYKSRIATAIRGL